MHHRACVPVALLLGGGMVLSLAQPGASLPPPEDIPEEILRTEIITEARSPLDGQLLSPAEYAQLQEQLQNSSDMQTLPAQVREVIFLLQLRRGLRRFIPIIP
ncbi:hypothetical protein H6G13_19965 [Pseudanabaena sp. FACHB-2040]|nr:hypothetical protein [Pseudanabaena sp. FACHB-2040]